MQNDLSREDWQYILNTMQERFNRARPKLSEGKPSKAFLEEEKRIMTFLDKKAFGQC